MPNRLKNLHIKRVDLVDVPANLDRTTGAGSFVKFWKRGPQESHMAKRMRSADDLEDARVLKRALGDVESVLESAEPIAKDGLAQDTGTRERLQAIQAQVERLLGEQAEVQDEDDEDAETDEDDRDEVLELTRGELEDVMAEAVQAAIAEIAEEEGIEPEAIEQSLLGGETDDEDDTVPDDEDEYAEDEDEDDDMEKRGIPVAVAKRFSHLAKRAEDAEARAERAERMATQERDQRLLRGYVELAEEFQALPVDPEQDGPVFKRMAEALTTRDAERIHELLRAADAQLATQSVLGDSITSTVGKRGDRPKHGHSAYEQLVSKADEIVKKDGKMSRERALVQAGEENPKLYEQYVAEQRQRSRG